MKRNGNENTGTQKAIRVLWIVLLIIVIAIGVLLYMRWKAGLQAQNAAQDVLSSVTFSPTETTESTHDSSPEPTAEADWVDQDADAFNNAYREDGDDGALLSDGAYVAPEFDEEAFQKLVDSIKNKTNDVDVIGVIRIPKTETELPILGKWSSKLLKISVCRYMGGEPNQPGNLVIAGHNYKTGAHFGSLKKLEVGDEIFLTGMDGIEKLYVVWKLDVVQPDDFGALQEYRGTCGLTLMTCYKDGTNRLFVRCEMADGQKGTTGTGA